MPYIGTSPSNAIRRRFIYEATASQTSFSGSDENGVTLTYVDSLYLDVFQNGVKLKAGDDYTATTGTTVVLATGASANDVVEMIAFDVFSVNDSVSASAGGNFGGNVAMAGTLAVTGVPTFTGRSVHSGGITVANAGQIGSVGDADSIAIASNGVVTFSQIPVFSAGSGVGLTRATEVDTTSGTAIDFTGIPSGTKFIKLIGANVSHNGAGGVPDGYHIIQLGDAGGFETSGYDGSFFEQNSAGSDGVCRDITNSSTGTNGTAWPATKNTNAAASMNITVDMRLIDEDTFTWAYSFISSFNGTGVELGAGNKSLSAELTQVRYKTMGGYTFDAGKMTIHFE